MGELFANLGINAKILAAQIVNFAILLLILQKFAYKPIVGMLNARRDEIAKANKHVEEIASRMKDIEEAKESVLKEARDASSEIIKKAEVNATTAAEHIVSEAKAQAQALAAQERKLLAQDREKLKEELRKDIGETVALAVEKSVGDILDAHAKMKLIEQAVAKAKTSK